MLGFDGAEHDEFWALFVGYMFAALRPTLPYFVLCLGGEQGTGKSTTAKVIRAFVDPHDTSIQPKPRTEDDLFANCDSQWITAYDNLSTIDQHWSDAFCRISTGTGYSKRKLYTDRDTVRFKVARPQVITAIDDVVAAPDLLDRSLLAQQPELDGDPADETELMDAVDALAPRVLGQLLDAAAVALNRQKAVKLRTVPRMVGPTKWIEAAAEVLGLAPGQFLEAYLDSQARAGELALESSLIGVALVDMLHGRDAMAALAEQLGKYNPEPVGFEGTAKDLLQRVERVHAGQAARRARLAEDAQGHGQRAAQDRAGAAQARLRGHVRMGGRTRLGTETSRSTPRSHMPAVQHITQTTVRTVRTVPQHRPRRGTVRNDAER